MSKAKYIAEGGTSNRPPYFDGSYYYFWKRKMQLFLKSQDIGVWRIIADGDFIPRLDQNDSTSAEKKEVDENLRINNRWNVLKIHNYSERNVFPGKAHSVQDMVRNIMRCLPIIRRPMVAAISQTKNLEVLGLEELIGTLRAHEVLLLEDKPIKKDKVITLKATQSSPSIQQTNEKSDSEDSQEDVDEEIALLTRMMRRRDQIKKGSPDKKDIKTEIDKSKITCFGWNKQGHYKTECLLNKKVPKKFPSRRSQ
ncbi:uncharacterized protein [Cicer arietinum]|uniref:uncharacterized protein n=1 Tax=Cicer arietinum TaxID=3827 RepID=UPI003CC69E27